VGLAVEVGQGELRGLECGHSAGANTGRGSERRGPGSTVEHQRSFESGREPSKIDAFVTYQLAGCSRTHTYTILAQSFAFELPAQRRLETSGREPDAIVSDDCFDFGGLVFVNYSERFSCHGGTSPG